VTSVDNPVNLKEEALHLPSWQVTPRQICDLELIINESFSPLTGFLNQGDYNSVLSNMRLESGCIWPIPITLDVTREFAESVSKGDRIVLRDHEFFALAILTIESIWEPDRSAEAQAVFGTEDTTHPGVNYLMNEALPVYLGGVLEKIELPRHYDFNEYRHTPKEMMSEFSRKNWQKIVAFQTRNPLHRAHIEMNLNASKELEAGILIHPVVGMTKPGDVDHYTRVRCYKAAMPRFPENSAMLSLLPLAMRMAGPREALWHALIRKNYGCTHFIVGRDHASPGNGADGKPFYGPYDAQDLLKKHEKEIGISMVPFKMMVYAANEKKYFPVDEIPEGAESKFISGSELRELLRDGEEIPEWFSYPEVVEELRKTKPKQNKRGFTIFFTGLSGSGKSTLANALMVKLLEDGRRPVTLLDGDIVRTHLSSELGFSKKDRSVNVRRIGFVASEITKNGGIAICAPIAPYEADRRFNRELIEPLGGYIEVHVNTPLDVCEARDAKGLYAKARAGTLKEFTGISDPYEDPENAEIVLNSTDKNPETLVEKIISMLKRNYYL